MKRRGNVLSPLDSVNTLVEMLVQTDSSVEDGETVWVRNLQTMFVYRINSGLTPDGLNVVASLYGIGVWQRLNLSSGPLASVTQTNWFIDSVGGSDSNTGASSTTALKTGAEFSRRNVGKVWDQGLYNVFIPNDLTAPDFLSIQGYRRTNSQIAVHGSLTPGAGQSVLYTSVAGMTARTSQVRATNTRGQITDAAVPTGTWTGAGLISTGVAPNKRIRTTTGSNVGAVAFPQKDLGAGAVAVSQWTVPFSTGLTPAAPPAEVTVAVNDQFVVEKLTHIDQFLVQLFGFDNAVTTNTGAGVYFESLDFTGAISTVVGETDPVLFIACTGVLAAGQGAMQPRSICFVWSSHMGGTTLNGPGTVQLWACHCTSGFTPQSGARVNVDGDTIFQGATIATVRRGGAIRIGTAAAFDAPGDALLVNGDGFARCDTGSAGANLIWGSGNGGFGVNCALGGRLIYVTTPIVTGSSGDFGISGVTTEPAFDRAAAPPAYTALRNLTWALLATAVAGGGFGGNVIDPRTGGGLVAA